MCHYVLPNKSKLYFLYEKYMAKSGLSFVLKIDFSANRFEESRRNLKNIIINEQVKA